MTPERSVGAGLIKVGMNNRQPQIAQLTARDSLPHSGASLCFGFQGAAVHWCPSPDRVRITGACWFGLQDRQNDRREPQLLLHLRRVDCQLQDAFLNIRVLYQPERVDENTFRIQQLDHFSALAKKFLYRDSKDFGKLLEPIRIHRILAGLIFLYLLGGDTNPFGKLFLCNPSLLPQLPQLESQVPAG